MSEYLLSNATIVTVDPSRSIHEDAALAIKDDRIAAIGETSVLRRQFPNAQEIDSAGKVLIPGLIDAHGHAGHSLIKTLGCDTPGLWMKIVTPMYFHYTTEEFWRADGWLSALDRVSNGVTTGVSIIGSAPRSDSPAFSIAHAEGYAALGIRGVLCTGPAGLPWPHPTTTWINGKPESRHVSFEQMMAGTEAVIESLHGSADGRQSVFVTPFTITPSIDPSNPTTPDRAVQLTADDRRQGLAVKALAAKHGVRIHSDAFGGHVRLAWQDPESAILGPNVHLQHCVGLSLDEVEILAETGTHMTHAPGGQAPVIEMLVRGVNVALTTDGTAPRVPFDILQAARSAQMAHRWRRNDNYLLPPGKLLKMITINAAQALGMDKDIGSLEVGKKADITIVDLRKPHLIPNWMVVHRLMYQATGQDVDSVFVDGKPVMLGRSISSIRTSEILEQAERESRSVVERAGLESHLTEPGWGQVWQTRKEPVDLPVIPRGSAQ